MTPILWDDILRQHVEVLDDLPREAVLMYWDYWTTCDPSANFMAPRLNEHGLVTDIRWRKEWEAELGPVERQVANACAEPLDLERELPEGFLRRFKRYLGDEFPKRVRAFPYLEYYRDHGFNVICGGAGDLGNNDLSALQDFPRYAGNMSCFAKRAVEAKALGVIATTWFPLPLAGYATPRHVCRTGLLAQQRQDKP